MPPRPDPLFSERVDGDLVRGALGAWRAAGGRFDALPGPLPRQARAIASGEIQTPTAALVDRLAVALGDPSLYDRAVTFERASRAGYTWPGPHPARKLSAEQVRAAHRLHLEGGLSIRELGRLLFERYGYASAKSCAQALSAAFRRDGLERRDRIAAVQLVNDSRGYVRGRSKRERRRQLRAELRASSPEFRAQEQARLAALRERYSRGQAV